LEEIMDAREDISNFTSSKAIDAKIGSSLRAAPKGQIDLYTKS
jgi:hypothetical protein